MNQIIQPLPVAQRVRRRPAVIFGSEGSDGVMCALTMLLGVMSYECRHGYASRLVVTRYADGSIQLQDDGRGLYLGSGQPEDDSVWKHKLCDFSCGPACPNEIDRSYEYSYFEKAERIPCRPFESEPFTDLDLCAVQCVSEFMDISVCRDGSAFTLHFEKGENVGGISVCRSEAPSGTKIRFRPDPEVFTCIHIPPSFLPDQLHQLALLTPNGTFCYQEETHDGIRENTFCFPKGMTDLLEIQRMQALSTAVYCTEITAKGRDRYNRPPYGARIRLALCFIKDGGKIDLFHNHQLLPNGGVHLERILSEIRDRLYWQLEQEITEEAFRCHLRLVVHTTTTPYASDWINGTRTGIKNAMLADMAQDCIRDNFSHYLKMHLSTVSEIFGIRL